MDAPVLPLQGDAPQLRTLLLTDLCDSTALVERLGDAVAAELFREHDAMVLRLQRQWRGRLIDRSDGLLLVFERPVDGLGFALDYMQALKELGDARGLTLRARAGLHVGEVLSWRNSEAAVQAGAKPLEVEGLAKPMAARLMALARPGQILVSAVAESLSHRAARELGERGERLLWRSHGRWRFKGIPTAQEVHEVGEIGLAPLRMPRGDGKARRDLPLWRRPAALVAEVALVAVIGTAGWFMTRPQPAIAFAERDWVVMGDVRNLTGDPLLDDSLQQAFRISLEQSRFVNVLSDLKVRDTLRHMRRDADETLDRATAAEVAVRDGARAVLLPTVAEVGGRVRVSLEVVDPGTQATVYAESESGRGLESVLGSVDAVTARMRARLGEGMPVSARSALPLPKETTDSLEALRAYALGQNALANARWKQAEEYYRAAIRFDPQFALAYIGVARVKTAISDREAALPFLDQALALKGRLSEKDRLYLEAWNAEIRETGQALQSWEMLASIYPDSFAGHGNAFWQLFLAGQLDRALVHAKAGDVAQNPYRLIVADDIGRIYLGKGALDQAESYFTRAMTGEKTGPGRRLANVHALKGRFDQAEETLRSIERSGYLNDDLTPLIDWISINLDQGKRNEARTLLDKAISESRNASDIVRAGFEFIGFSLDTTESPSALDLVDLRHWQQEQLQTYAALPMESPYRIHRAGLILAAAYLAQRTGDDSLSDASLRVAAPLLEATHDPVIEKMVRIVRGERFRLRGQYEDAIQLLSAEDDDLVQSRVALHRVLLQAGRHAEALEQARWLSSNRGLAYAESPMGQALQLLNVTDTKAASTWMEEERRL